MLQIGFLEAPLSSPLVPAGPSDAKEKAEDELKKAIGARTPYSREESSKLFECLRNGVEACFTTLDYTCGIQLLSDYTLVHNFKSQPKSLEELSENRFVEFCAYQYLLHLYNQVWFRKDSEEDRDTMKTLNSIFNKASIYCTKNSALVEQRPDLREVRMLNLMKVISLATHFKSLNFRKFHTEFLAIVDVSRDILSELPVFKSKLMVMFSVVLLFIKPFCELIALENFDSITDLFTTDAGFESVMYQQVLKPLSEGDLSSVITLFRQPKFRTQFTSHIGFAVPQSKTDFFSYMVLMVDLKNIMLLLSMTAKIPRIKFISLLGYSTDSMDEAEIAQVHSNIILLMASLSLGSIGVGYNVEGDYYYNNGTHEGDFKRRLDAFSNEVESESVATAVKGVLIERFFS